MPKRLSKVGLLLVSSLFFVSSCSVASSEEAMVEPNTEMCSVTKDSSGLTPLTVINASNLATAPYIQWGIQNGCFAKYGLDVKTFETGQANVEKLAALVGGSADIAAESSLEAIAAVSESGVEISFVAGAYEYTSRQLEQALIPELVDGKLALEVALVAAPGIDYQGVENLLGSRIGVINGWGPARAGIEKLLRESDFPPEKVTFVEASIQERMALLEKGEIQFASLTSATVFQAMDFGAELVLYPGAYFYQPGTAMTWYTTKEIATEKESELIAFQEAIREIHTLLMDPDNLPAFRDFLVEDYGLDETVVERFALPNLVTRELTREEYEYLTEVLFEAGVISGRVSLPLDLIFTPSAE